MAYLRQSATPSHRPPVTHLGNGAGRSGQETETLNLVKYSDGTAEIGTPARNVGWCSLWSHIVAPPNWQTIPRNTKIIVIARWNAWKDGVKVCSMLVGSVPSLGLTGWLRGGMTIDETKICEDSAAKNTGQPGDCIYPRRGCTDGYANNTDPLADRFSEQEQAAINAELCSYDQFECWDGTVINPRHPDQSCPNKIAGCLDPNARNTCAGCNFHDASQCLPSLRKKCWYSNPKADSTWAYVDQECDPGHVCHPSTSDQYQERTGVACKSRLKIYCHVGTPDGATYYASDVGGKCPSRPLKTDCWNGKHYYRNRKDTEPQCPTRRSADCWLGTIWEDPFGRFAACPTQRSRNCWNGKIWEKTDRTLPACPPDTRRRGCTQPSAYNYDSAAVVDNGTCQYYPSSCPQDVRYCRDGAVVGRQTSLFCKFTSCRDGTVPQPYKWDEAAIKTAWDTAEKEALAEVMAPFDKPTWKTIKLNAKLVSDLADHTLALAKRKFAADPYIKKLTTSGWLGPVQWKVLGQLTMETLG